MRVHALIDWNEDDQCRIERVHFFRRKKEVHFFLCTDVAMSSAQQEALRLKLEDWLPAPMRVVLHCSVAPATISSAEVNQNAWVGAEEEEYYEIPPWELHAVASSNTEVQQDEQDFLQRENKEPSEHLQESNSSQNDENEREKKRSTTQEDQSDEPSRETPEEVFEENFNFYETPMIVSRTVPASSSEGSQATKGAGSFPKKFVTLSLAECLQTSKKNCAVTGCVRQVEASKSSKSDWHFLSMLISDAAGEAMRVKAISNDEKIIEGFFSIKKGMTIQLYGRRDYDDFQKTMLFQMKAWKEVPAEQVLDTAQKKRVEWAVHTQMSLMEGLIRPKALKERLQLWGHSAFGLTDRCSVQSYPMAFDLFKGSGIDVYYGVDAKILHQEHKILTNLHGKDLSIFDESYTVFDIETTGFSRFNDHIIEIGAVRYEQGQRVQVFSKFVKPPCSIPAKITELTGIEDDMVRDADPIDIVLPEFLNFAQDSIFVAHNADFDIGFITENARRCDLEFEPVVLDTLGLARALHPEFKNHKLNTLTKECNVTLLNHHRACDDAQATGEIFLKLMKEWQALDLPLESINQMPSGFALARHTSEDLLLYIRNQQGVKPLYELLSRAHTEYFFKEPGILDTELAEVRSHFYCVGGHLGSALFESVALSMPEHCIVQQVQKLDAIAIQPPLYVEAALRRELVANLEHYEACVKKLVSLAKTYDKPCIAINAPFYLDKRDQKARNVLRAYNRQDQEYNDIFRLYTTGEMEQALQFLGEDLDFVLYEGTERMREELETIIPVPQGTFTPHLPGAEEELSSMTFNKAKSLYGDPLPKIVEDRLRREIDSIISNGYASLYVIAQRLVKKSNEDGYLVGSRGSVGSSFAATMADITEVNPLPPHYRCPECKHSEFILDQSVGCGYDLPPKVCPHCGTPLKREGHDIPFEVFLGFHGDKEPDIDLNFAGEYMPTIHRYTEELFGKGKVFRAGTISGIQAKTAYGYVRKYLEDERVPIAMRQISDEQIECLTEVLEGTKRTTGQHAGGLMIVPQEMDIYDFCPVQYPADSKDKGVTTTHFSYKNLSGRMLKLDELGHTSPSAIRDLQEMTGIDPLAIEFDDPETMQIFKGTESLAIEQAYSNEKDGSLGIPEFGTYFVRGMLKDTNPTTFSELVRISGLSHGTDVWTNNAQDLIREGKTDLSHAICTRDDIMLYLIAQGMDKSAAFKTMEAVRKGKGIPDGIEPLMREVNVPQWYIDSCNKIQYMFPKAHAAAYVMMSYRIAWFKVHQPAAFYASCFTQRLNLFSTEMLHDSLESVQNAMHALKQKDKMQSLEEMQYGVLELIEEMYARGLHFAPVSLEESKGARFTTLDEKTVLPPFSAISGISEAVGNVIESQRNTAAFETIETFSARTGIKGNTLEAVRAYGLLQRLPEKNQLDFFSL